MMKLAAFWAIVLNVQSLLALEPFTVTDVSRRFDSTGSVASESRFLFARNRQTSIASVDLDPNSGGLRQVIDVTGRRTLLIDPSSQSATEMDRGAMRACCITWAFWITKKGGWTKLHANFSVP